MGNYTDIASSNDVFQLVSFTLSAIVLGLFALLQENAENDDDDSDSGGGGGGLMQPIT